MKYPLRTTPILQHPRLDLPVVPNECSGGSLGPERHKKSVAQKGSPTSISKEGIASETDDTPKTFKLRDAQSKWLVKTVKPVVRLLSIWVRSTPSFICQHLA